MQTITQDLIDEFLKKKNVFAVVGVSEDTAKYGNKVYSDLKRTGYSVYPINPNATAVLGDRCYPRLRDLPVVPDVVNIVVPPKITEKTVKECKDLGIDKVWMQPGSESKKAITFSRTNGIKVLHAVCVMMEMREARGCK